MMGNGHDPISNAELGLGAPRVAQSITVEDLARFGLAVLDEHRRELADVDGGTLHELALRHGVTRMVHLSGSCEGERQYCRCDEAVDCDEERWCCWEVEGLSDLRKRLNQEST